MAIHTHWHNPQQTILIMVIDGTWEIEEYYERYMQAKKMIESVQHPVAVLIDMRQSLDPPKNMLSTASFNKKNRASNLTFTTMVGAPRLIRLLSNIMSRIVSKSGTFAMVDTVEEAHRLMAERLQTLAEKS